ncbi:multiheme c-type cytochrome [Thermodesulfobacteriota bacterium]
MKRWYGILLVSLFLAYALPGICGDVPVSDATEECLSCHATIHPGIVADWRRSRHAMMTPVRAMEVEGLGRKVSSKKIPEGLRNVVVGCAECHTQNPSAHQDTFDHNDHEVHIVVSPKNCATCHREEFEQYGENLMSNAYANLKNNTLYEVLVNSVNGLQSFKDMKTTLQAPDQETQADSCYFCHGTVVEVKGRVTRDTSEGEMEFPVLSGWPNQGVGRINPDGSKGACTSCHARHQFSIAMARKPYTCSECHKGPDVPAYKVYEVSKHGNIFSSLGNDWDFKSVPWIVGKDFTSPSCAACHVSLLASDEGEVIAERTHRMNDRIPWRILGLIYAHPHPLSPDTTKIRNLAGLPLPTELTGEPVSRFLIDKTEQEKRKKEMQKICLGCHSRGWVEGQFARFENTIKTTNEMTLTTTKIMLKAWEKGAAKGLAQSDSIFNEALEKKWVEHWLFYANTVRYASAMMGADYGVFANGRWYMSKNIQEMLDHLEMKLKK